MSESLESKTRVEPDGRAATPPEEVDRGSIVGRYIVSGVLGRGGMGIVYAAYDPELDRRVAVKLLSVSTGGSSPGSTRLLREAQALARLNHPNVVAIHDVGTLGARVWLAMEYVDGQTLRAWLREHEPRWREILRVMGAVGQGIAAAHAAGLVHRDLKPDNIMIGRDGRVRVMDFGLARSSGPPAEDPRDATLRVSGRQDALARAVTEHGLTPGTPGYMAPEQWLGGDADARADQFAFCVTLWEALYGERPFAGDERRELAGSVLRGEIRAPTRADRFPAWLRQALVRGLQTDREQRFPTMEALLAALAQGETQARTWRLTGALAAAAALVAAVPVWQSREEARREAACAAAGDEIRAVWNERAANQLAQSLTSTGATYAATTAEKVTHWFDAWVDQWSKARAMVCHEAEHAGALPAELVPRARACLDDRRGELTALLAVIKEDPVASLPRAVSAAADLSPVETCLDADALARRPALSGDPTRLVQASGLRRELERVQAMLTAGRYVDGVARAEELLSRARTLGDPALVAEVLAAAGHLNEQTGDFPRARALLLVAYADAAAIGADDLAADVVSTLVYLLAAREGQLELASQWVHVGEALWRRLGAPEDLRAARSFHVRATLMRLQGRSDEAQRLLERALAIQERLLGVDHPDLALSLNGLGNLMHLRGDFESAIALYERSLALFERALGSHHPNVAKLLNNLGAMKYLRGDFDEAKALLKRSLALREELDGPDAPEALDTRENLSLVLLDQRAYGEAIPILRQVLARREHLLGPRHPKFADTAGNLARALGPLGALDEALSLAEHAVSIYEESKDSEGPELAQALMVLGELHRLRGDLPRAQQLFERELAIRERTQEPTSPELGAALTALGGVLLVRGELARSRELLARALALRDADPQQRLGTLQLLHVASTLERRAGALDRAQAFAERALEFSRGAAVDDAARVLPLVDLAEIALARGRPLDALPRLERAVELTGRGDLQPETYGLARLVLARALAAADREPDRVRVLAAESARAFRTLGPLRTEPGELAKWLTNH